MRLLLPLILRLVRASARGTTLADVEESISVRRWLGYFEHAPALEISPLLQTLTERELSKGELAAYDAPFPEQRYMAGPRRLPALVATDFAQVAKDWEALSQWPHPVLTLFSDKDPFLSSTPIEAGLQARFPGAVGQPHQTTAGASHFLQEDKGEELTARMLAWLDETGFAAGSEAKPL